MTEIDMRLVTRQTEAERHREYRQANQSQYRRRDASRKRAYRAAQIPEFIGVDGEGVWVGKIQRYVLLGVGDKQYENPSGIQWQEAFEFLYSQYERHPRAAFVGFFLGYDFNKILSHEAGLPLKAARMLLTKEGKALRKVPENHGYRQSSFPVRCDGWEFDLLGKKRLSIRPVADGCRCGEKGIKCPCSSVYEGKKCIKRDQHKGWMHICDAGAFYQMGFIKVIDPIRWKDDPDGPVCTIEEYNRVLKGKNKRSRARLNDEMRYYNVLENLLLARVMERLAKGYLKVGIRPSKDQWYGPGATASKWLAKEGLPKRSEIRKKHDGKAPLMPKWFWEACHMSYFGGWFEIFSHGLQFGVSYNYDINNAYPYAASKLPHICGECRYTRSQGAYNGNGNYVLLFCTVFSRNTRIGAMPHRTRDGSILRPSVTKGWYWKHEIDAAKRAGLVKKVMVSEYMEFKPCAHPGPLAGIEDLYYERLRVGKDSAQGMAIKLNNNSIYGKFAQSVGAAPYGNWLYASLITAGCRIQILDAIATHPNGAESVLMVATDGICFDSPNGNLPVSKRLGDWAYVEYNDLCLFKPGVYWHKEGKEALAKLKIKSRGVPAKEFEEGIAKIEAWFYYMQRERKYPGQTLWNMQGDIDNYKLEIMAQRPWPWFYVHVNFRMKSGAQALNEGHWEKSGEVLEKVPLLQDSDPHKKRRIPHFNMAKGRIDTYTHDLPIMELETSYHGKVKRPTAVSLGYNFDGDALGPILEAGAALRDKEANYDLPLAEEIEWETIWEGQ